MRRTLLVNAVWGAVLALLPLAASQSPGTPEDLALVAKRRTFDLAQFPNPPWYNSIDNWVKTQKDDGTWADVNYISGCPAQRANWPIQQHWNRLITFASAWSGVNPSVPSNWTNDTDLFAAIGKGLDYWFTNDYNNPDCVGNGGMSGNCPCGTPGLWNTNWYDQAILIPQLVSITCLLMDSGNLTTDQRTGCERIPRRSYDLIDGTYGTGGHLTGANVVLVMQNSVSLALYTKNATMLQDTFARAMAVMTFSDAEMSDGIHRDGTFLQHKGVLYNGNYGKDLLNAFIQLEAEAIGTTFAADDATREAMSTYIRGDEWMIFVDNESKQEHWDFNAIGRFVAFPAADLQANSDINFNVTKLAAATADFTGQYAVNDTIRRLQSNGTEKLVGNKGFWASDYMVHRHESFILGNKMVSTRSVSTETVNGANPYGYHIGQGNLFTYVKGTEYNDIMASWDWNLIPGTTVLLDRPNLQTVNTNITGGKDNFVGVVSDGQFGASAMKWVDPVDGTLSYQKAWFFFQDHVVVVTDNITHTGEAPVVTVLDNRKSTGGKILVDGIEAQRGADTKVKGKTLYYGGNGYMAYDTAFALTLSDTQRTGNWSAISTSTAGVVTVPIFSAYASVVDKSFSYAVFPATSQRRLEDEAQKPTSTPIIADGITGAYSTGKVGLIFWPGGKNYITLQMKDLGWHHSGSVTIKSDKPGAYLFSTKCKSAGTGLRLDISLSDPTQRLNSTSFSLQFIGAKARKVQARGEVNGQTNETGVSFEVDMPTGGLAGSSVSRKVYVDLS